MSGDGGDKAYAGIVKNIATLARKLGKKDSYKSAPGHDALLSFADHLEGIVAATGVKQTRTIRVSFRGKRTYQE